MRRCKDWGYGGREGLVKMGKARSFGWAVHAELQEKS